MNKRHMLKMCVFLPYLGSSVLPDQQLGLKLLNCFVMNKWKYILLELSLRRVCTARQVMHIMWLLSQYWSDTSTYIQSQFRNERVNHEKVHEIDSQYYEHTKQAWNACISLVNLVWPVLRYTLLKSPFASLPCCFSNATVVKATGPNPPA